MMIWRQVCRPCTEVISIVVLNDDLRKSRRIEISIPEIFVVILLYLGDSEVVSLPHVLFE
jgi:hypothetical protein